MPITEQQREARRKCVGASDVPRILLGDAQAVWMEKTGRLDGIAETEAMRAGTLLESVVIDYAASVLGSLIRNQIVPAAGLDFPLASNCDALVAATHEPVEAKTTGIVGPAYGTWGDDGSDVVPDRHILQVTAQMICTGTQQAHVPALIGGRGFAMFTVPFDQMIADAIVAACREFWRCVTEDRPPEAGESPRLSEDVARRVRRVPKSVSPFEVDAAVVDAWRTANEFRLRWEKAEDAAKEEIFHALGPCESVVDTRGRTLTYMPIKSKGVDLDAFREAHPDLAKQFTVVSESRKLSLSKGQR